MPTRMDSLGTDSEESFLLNSSNPSFSIDRDDRKSFSPSLFIQHTSNFSFEISIPRKCLNNLLAILLPPELGDRSRKCLPTNPPS